MTETFEQHISITPAHRGLDAPSLLAQCCPLSKQQAKDAMSKGAVWLTRHQHTQRLRRKTRSLQQGDEVHIYYNPAVLAARIEPPVLMADEHDYSIWNKPCGVFSQGSKWGDHCTVARHAETTLQPQRQVYTVHRLDRATRGLIMLAHSKSQAALLAKLFRNRAMDKRYLAIVHGITEAAFDANATIDGKTARSIFRRLAVCNSKQLSLLEVDLESGRKHQIRRHLSMLGYPIVGDRLYGQPPVADAALPDLQLQAFRLAFELPDRGLVDYCIAAEDRLKLA